VKRVCTDRKKEKKDGWYWLEKLSSDMEAKRVHVFVLQSEVRRWRDLCVAGEGSGSCVRVKHEEVREREREKKKKKKKKKG